MAVNYGKLERLEEKVNTIFRPRNPNLPTATELKDFLTFTKYFYRLATGREFEVSQPIGRRSHQLILTDLVPDIISHKINRLLINIPPRYGKTIWAIHLVAYGLAFYPDSQYLYISYSAELAIKQTATIRSILELPQFTEIFGVCLNPKFSSKHDFMTNAGGRVVGAGAGGTITGNGAGIKYCKRFGGLAILDDIHKPDEVHSAGIRASLKDWFQGTFSTRVNDDMTPIIGIGQILNEDDILMNLRNGNKLDFPPENKLDPRTWQCIILKGLDEALNALDPRMHTVERHLEMKVTSPYMWWSQYQQEPQPAGGSVFQNTAFPILDEMPEILETFITVDTAETTKNYSDFTVFSFWGMYKIKINNTDSPYWGLHWLNCQQFKIEPKELQDRFMQFYYDCCQFKIQPIVVGIEKKSTGATLLSVLSEIPGMRVINTIEHRVETKKIDEFKDEFIRRSNKIDRFLSCQEFVSRKRITFDKSMKHARMCIDHLGKITANDSHLHDDIADTMSDAILMIPWMEKQIRKPNSQYNIPGYKAIPNYKATRKKWH